MAAPFVVWDLDGTLIDSGRDIAIAANAARADLGLPPLPEETVRAYVGEGAARLMDRAIGETEPAERRRLGLDRFFVRYGENLVVHTKPYPGIDALVKKLRGRQAISTNKPGVFARGIVERLGWTGDFTALVGAGDVPNRKPAPDAVLKALALAGARVDESVFVGDTPIDIATARAVGIRFIGVSWGLRPRSELTDAPLIVDTAGALEAALLRME
jgi:phosphoglycolate phosphatase